MSVSCSADHGILSSGPDKSKKTRKLNKPASRLSVGDVVSLPLGAQIVELRVVDFGTRRGPASEAQQLYERLEARDTGEG